MWKKLTDKHINVCTISSRAVVASEIPSLPPSNMVERTRVKAMRIMLHPPTMPQMKKKVCIVRIALAEKKQDLHQSYSYHLPPPKELHQTKCRGHHNQAIDEIRVLGLGAATPMVTIWAKVASTMVCWKHQNDEGRYVFFVGNIFTPKSMPKQH